MHTNPLTEAATVAAHTIALCLAAALIGILTTVVSDTHDRPSPVPASSYVLFVGPTLAGDPSFSL